MQDCLLTFSEHFYLKVRLLNSAANMCHMHTLRHLHAQRRQRHLTYSTNLLPVRQVPCWYSITLSDVLWEVQTMVRRKQTLLFTATMTSPLQALQESILKDPCVVMLVPGLATVSNLKEQFILVPAKVKEVYLMHILGRFEELKVRSAMIFCAKKHSCELLGGLLHKLECKAVTLHGDKKQKARLAALHQVCVCCYMH